MSNQDQTRAAKSDTAQGSTEFERTFSNSREIPRETNEPTHYLPPAGTSPTIATAPAAVKRSMPMALSIAGGIILAAVLSWFCYHLMWFILLLYLSYVLATIVEAPVHYLTQHRVPRTLGTLVVLLGAILIIAGVGGLMVSSLNHQMATFQEGLRELPPRINDWVNNLQARFPSLSGAFKDFNIANTVPALLPSPSVLLGHIWSTAQIVTYAIVTFFLIMYMVIEGPDQLRNLRRLLPKHTRLEATNLFHALTKTHRGWFLASAGNVASSATLSSIGLAICGIPGALLLGIIAGCGELIPNIGPAVFAVPAVLVTIAVKPDMVLWVLGMFLIVQTIQGYTITPQMVKISIKLPVLVTLVSVVVMGTLFGILGVLVAIPLTADLVVVWNYVNSTLEKDTTDQDLTNAAPAPARETIGPAPPTAPPPRRRGLFWNR